MTDTELTALHTFLRDQMARDEVTVRDFSAALIVDMDAGVGGTRVLREVPVLYEATTRRRACREMLAWHASMSPAEVRAEVLANLIDAARVHPSSTSWAANVGETYERLAWAEMHRALQPAGRLGRWGRDA